MILGKYTPEDAELVNDHLDHYMQSAKKQLAKLSAINDVFLREMTEREREYYRHVVSACRWMRVRKHQIMTEETIGFFDRA